MKKLVLSLFAFTIAILIVAQEKPKIKEVGIVFSNLDNFGLSFKIGKEKALWRINALLISGGNSERTKDTIVSKDNSFGFGIGIGREYRKTIAKNFEFRYGADLSFSYHHQKSELKFSENSTFSTTIHYVPRINFVLGFNYVIKEQFIIGAEILPYISYTFGSSVDENSTEKTETDFSRIGYGLSNTSIMVSVGYRF